MTTTASPCLSPPTCVVLASTQSTWGGGEAYLFALAQGLLARGVEVRLLAPVAGQLAQRMQDRLPEIGQCDASRKSPAAIWRMRQWMKSLGPAVLHCNDSRSLSRMGLAAAGLKSLRVVSMRHTMFPIRSTAKYHRLSQKVICVSHAVADACGARGLSPAWTQVIHAAIDPPQVLPADVERLRSDLLGSEHQKIIVAVGNLFSCKGHSTLIDAAALLRYKGCKALTVIAGEGRQRAVLEQQIETLGLANEVRLLGFRDDANTLLAAADVIAHPARDEGLCLTVAAAMMLKRPVVATAVGGLSDVLGIEPRMQADGPFAAVVPVDDEGQLAEQLYRQLDSPADEQALTRAQDFALTRFTTPRMVDATLALYQDLFRQQRAAA
ncbi:Alpha-D-kanosaminyltransferase [Rosistilla carotiformis]|uniref:Alpha-D-kanosaminyltransferase n=1 Tax=Rosistilla carotiformis TaxID=2528017 RepID=A0A518JQ39_9BACT|nr:glycosyltransferase [Rosistilla carotiformis]QDV67638.1 Alpha-D-kanosaminyltransferase [Rosistilla carotiformis]